MGLAKKGEVKLLLMHSGSLATSFHELEALHTFDVVTLLTVNHLFSEELLHEYKTILHQLLIADVSRTLCLCHSKVIAYI